LKDEEGEFSGLMTMALDITAKVESEKALLESEERFRRIFQDSPIGLGLIGDGGRILMANPAFAGFVGFSTDELNGRPFGEITHPDDLESDLSQYQLLMAGHVDRYELDKRFFRKDREVVWGHLTATSIRSKDGLPLYALGMVQDITQKRKAEETQKRLVAILEQTADAVVAIDLDGKVTDWNRGAELLYGYSAPEVVGTIPSFLPQGYHQEMLANLERETQKGNSFYKYEARRRRKDGKWMEVEANFSSLKDEKGRLIGFSVIARDITEKKKTEGVRAQLSAILQQTSDAVVGTDLDGNVLSWNRGAENLFGYNLEEVLGRPVGFLAPEDRKHESMELRAIVQAGENISNFETVRIRKDGQTLDVSVSMSPIHDSEGKMIGGSSIHRDISERKKAEEFLKQHEEQLRQVEKMNAIGRLAGGVAHDFNNLLSVIGGNAEFLKTSLDPQSPSQDEVLEIQKAVQRGSDLAKQLLVFGQRQVSQPQPVNLNEVSADMKKMLKRLIDANVELAIIQDPSLKPILADPGQIQQIILNLVINARDAMPQGGHLILETKQITAERLEAEGRPTLPIGDYVRFAATDTGIGMSPEVQRHIFEPFFTTKAGKGTGLGLATVYTLVRKWSGHIFVHSSPGIGTTFTLYFPAMVSTEGFEEKPKQVSLIPVGTETILLAEDEDQVRKVLVRSLERYGYRVLSAPNGLEAVKVAWEFKEPIHLLLTDTIMPKMNGRELMVEVKKTRPKIKVLFVSGYPKEVLSQQGILDSGIHLVQKPFELEELVKQVRRILDEK
jgi:PAS domain S-box-containing protein